LAFTIRPGTEEDVPEMLRLWREMMDFHARVESRFRPAPPPVGEQVWEKYVRESILGSEDWCVFVAEADGRLVGQIMGNLREQVPVFESGRYGYVTDVVVDPAVRRNGVGRALFGTLKGWMCERGVSCLQLQVAHNNPASQAFWREMGCTDFMHTLWYDLVSSQ
jgi:ribosomal protein S18 acetylase RimI-like enzyme